MHVAFDPQTFSLQPYGGVSRYFLEMALRLGELPDTRVSLLAFAHLNAYLRAAESGAVIGWPIPVLPEPLRHGLVRVNQALARSWLSRHRPDVVHETYYSRVGTAPSGVPTVITVHDMIHEKFPDYAPRTSRIAGAKRAALERADHVICVSENTRRDLRDIYGTDPARVSVVRHGVSFHVGEPPVARHPVEEPCILFVGKRDGYKDFGTLLRAYAGAGALRRSHLLQCFGDEAFSPAELALMARLGVPRERVRHATGNDAALGGYYRRAALFVYPSRYEGFGMPPLEAMACDCPVVCSDAASLPEVVGDAASLFPAGDEAALRAAMEHVLGSPSVAEDLRRKGRERLKLFSWERCAQETRAVYASVIRRCERPSSAA